MDSKEYWTKSVSLSALPTGSSRAKHIVSQPVLDGVTAPTYWPHCHQLSLHHVFSWFWPQVTAINLGGYLLAFGGVCWFNYTKLQTMKVMQPSHALELPACWPIARLMSQLLLPLGLHCSIAVPLIHCAPRLAFFGMHILSQAASA